MSHTKIKPLRFQSLSFLKENHNKLFPVKPSSLRFSKEYLNKMKENNLEVKLFTETGEAKGFIYDNEFILPEPDPIVIMFNTSHIIINNLEEYKKTIKEKCINKNDTIIDLDNLIHDLYNFYSLSFTFITSLFNAVEGVINRSIPSEYVYNKKSKNGTVQLSSIEIQRNVNILDKINKILPRAQNKKTLSQMHKKEYDDFIRLKAHRDEIIHLKINKEVTYESLLNSLLCINYNRYLKSVKTIINYYKEDLIETCNCHK